MVHISYSLMPEGISWKKEDNNREYYGNVIAELGEERTTQILSDMRTLVEAMEHASKKMHLKEAE